MLDGEHAPNGQQGTTHDNDDAIPEIGRPVVTARGVLAGSATFCLAGAIVATAVAWPAPARADPVSSLLNDFGFGNNGAVSTAVGQLASGFCPFLGEQGSQVAAQVAAGAEPTIDPECAAFMMAIANGDIAALINASGVLGQSTTANPLTNLGVATSNPLSVPGI